MGLYTAHVPINDEEYMAQQEVSIDAHSAEGEARCSKGTGALTFPSSTWCLASNSGNGATLVENSNLPLTHVLLAV